MTLAELKRNLDQLPALGTPASELIANWRRADAATAVSADELRRRLTRLSNLGVTPNTER